MIERTQRNAGRAARRIIGAAGIAALALTAGATGAVAQEQDENAPSAISRDASPGSKSDILLVMDESGSLVGSGTDGPRTRRQRVEAAQAFVSRMAEYAEVTESDINIRLAGFGGTYNAATDWTALESDGDGTNLDGDIEAFADRANEDWTDHSAGLSGGGRGLRGRGEPPPHRPVFQRRPAHRRRFFPEAIMDQVCHADGPVGRLRASGIQVFTIGLSSGSVDRAAHAEDLRRRRLLRIGGQRRVHRRADASALTAAFEKMAPSLGLGFEQSRQINDSVEFTLDNSVSPVKLSVTPTGAGLEDIGSLTPVLTPPGGEPTALTEGVSDVAAIPSP